MIRTRAHLAFFAFGWTVLAVLLCVALAVLVFDVTPSSRSLALAAAVPAVVTPLPALLGGRMIMHLNRMSQKLQHAVDHDSLTSTVTRQYFFDKLQSLAPDTSSILLLIDIDQFRAINDTHGHFVGDIVLRETAHRLINNTRRDDLVARFGCEEFIVLLPNTSPKDAAHIAERMRATVARTPIRTSVSKIPVTVSIGIGHIGDGNDSQAAMQEADDALYAANTAGCNLVKTAA